MSDLWDRCSRALRERLGPDDWRRTVGRLRGWIDGDLFYLWVDRAANNLHAIPNPAREFDREIRETIQLVCGRAPKGLHYLDRPPNRERIINERRVREQLEQLPIEQARRNERLKGNPSTNGV